MFEIDKMRVLLGLCADFVAARFFVHDRSPPLILPPYMNEISWLTLTRPAWTFVSTPP